MIIQFISLRLYNTFIAVYWLSIYVASFFNEKAKQWIAGRKYWQCGLGAIELKEGKRIWFHCASLGEFEQARPVIEKLRHERKQDIIIITFFSPSGYEVQKNYKHADLVTYLPLDTICNAKEFIKCLNPDIVLFVKYEFWFHYLNELKNKNIPVILFSSVFRRNQIFFKWYGGFFRNMLNLFTKIFVQNSQSKELLKSISVDAQVAFDTRFDRVFQIAENRKLFPLLEKFKASSKILIAGSTWKKDEELILQTIKENVLRGYKYIITPHNIDEKGIEEIIKSIPLNAKRFSALTETNAVETDAVIIDNIGNLSSLYAYGDIAYIGGGFNASVHNVLEAAVYGIPVLFGPNFKKTEEAKELIELSGAFNVESFADLKQKLLAEIPTGESTKPVLEKYIKNHLGGTEEIFKSILLYV